MSGKTQNSSAADRIYWLDNLRTFAVFLVIVLHAGLVYESSGVGASFWIVDDPSTNDLSGLLNLIIDIIAMPTIFFISGFLVPSSVRRKNGWEFLKSKFRRLVIPWGIAVFTLIPIYKVIFLYSRNLPQEHWTTYFHWTNGIWGQNWLWFLPVLFLFNLLYLFLSRLRMKMPDIALKPAIGIAFLIGLLYSFIIDVLGWQGWTKTIFIDFQNERLLLYFLTFLIGASCYRLKTFNSEQRNRKLYVWVNCTLWVPTCLYFFLVIHFLISPGVYLVSGIIDLLMLRFTFLVTLVGSLYLLVDTFRRHFNKQGGIGRELSHNSYSVYIIHVIVMGGIALIMLDTAIPSLVKHMILVVGTFVASNLLVSGYRKAVRPAGHRRTEIPTYRQAIDS